MEISQTLLIAFLGISGAVILFLGFYNMVWLENFMPYWIVLFFVACGIITIIESNAEGL